MTKCKFNYKNLVNIESAWKVRKGKNIRRDKLQLQSEHGENFQRKSRVLKMATLKNFFFFTRFSPSHFSILIVIPWLGVALASLLVVMDDTIRYNTRFLIILATQVVLVERR